MASITIRNLDDRIKARLRLRAACVQLDDDVRSGHERRLGVDSSHSRDVGGHAQSGRFRRHGPRYRGSLDCARGRCRRAMTSRMPPGCGFRFRWWDKGPRSNRLLGGTGQSALRVTYLEQTAAREPKTCRLTLLSTHAERLFAVVGPGAELSERTQPAQPRPTPG